jgi:hypothetical protein
MVEGGKAALALALPRFWVFEGRANPPDEPGTGTEMPQERHGTPLFSMFAAGVK